VTDSIVLQFMALPGVVRYTKSSTQQTMLWTSTTNTASQRRQ